MVVSDINVTLSIALNLSTVFFAHSLPFLPSILTVSEFKRPPIKKSSSAKITFAPELAAESKRYTADLIYRELIDAQLKRERAAVLSLLFSPPLDNDIDY